MYNLPCRHASLGRALCRLTIILTYLHPIVVVGCQNLLLNQNLRKQPKGQYSLRYQPSATRKSLYFHRLIYLGLFSISEESSMVKSLNWVNLSTPPPLGSVTHILPLSIMLMPQKSIPPLCRSSCTNFLDIGLLFAKPPRGATDQSLQHAPVTQNR